jgi:hypothetical protein
LHWSVSCILQVEVNKEKVIYNVKLLMGSAFLAEKKLSFIMKLFHFVCEKRLLNWLQVRKKTDIYDPLGLTGVHVTIAIKIDLTFLFLRIFTDFFYTNFILVPRNRIFKKKST